MNQQDRDEFIILKEDVKHIKEDVTTIKEEFKQSNDILKKLTSKLFNDDETGEIGYLELTKRNGVRLTKLENIRAITYGVVMAVGMLLGWYLKFRAI